MFSSEERDRIRDLLIDRARSDPRVAAAAAVGASATGGDRWSDLDLTFGVVADVPIETVLADWTRTMTAGFAAAVLFDVPVHSTIYRVFLLPGALQVDLSFTPAAAFGARGPRFHLLFGEAIEHPFAPQPTASHIFGYGVHHLVRSHICIARKRPLQAEYWIHEARVSAMLLACLRLGLDTNYGRGFDSLPADVHEPLAAALVRDLSEEELRRALAVVMAGLVREAAKISAIASQLRQVQPMLQSLS